jgi:hypothetical protein
MVGAAVMVVGTSVVVVGAADTESYGHGVVVTAAIVVLCWSDRTSFYSSFLR